MTLRLLEAFLAVTALTAAWLIPRRVAGAPMTVAAAGLLDFSPVFLIAVLLLIASGRPLFSAAALLALGGGFAFIDKTKRHVLREPVVFSDMSELPHLFSHPHLYVPFAGSPFAIAAGLAMTGLLIGLLWRTDAWWEPDWVPIASAGAAIWVAGWTFSREPMLSLTAAWLRRLRPAGDPITDAAQLGPFAVLLVYGVIARAERAERGAPFRALPMPAIRDGRCAVPVILVQCESFFDARRLSPCVPADLLPGFDACLRRGAIYGRLATAAWGANTMRTEFAVLTGIPEEGLGYDRFNPYHAFARTPIASLASRLRAENYRTLCLHPFDRRFFRRNLTMPALGFDAFLGCEAIGGPCRPPYRSDPDLARQIITVLDAAGPRTFIFAITMGNHGPWPPEDAELDPSLYSLLCELNNLPDRGKLLRYLSGLARSDEMLAILVDELRAQRDAVFGFYGDHLPSLPSAFDLLGFDDLASDYVLVDGLASDPSRLDLPAHRLGSLILHRLDIKTTGAPRAQATGAAA